MTIPSLVAEPSGAASWFSARTLSSGLAPGMLDRLVGRVTVAVPPVEMISVPVPFTGEVLGRIPRGTAADVEAAVAHARSAQGRWGALEMGDRARVLRRFHDLLLDRRGVALDLIQLESGKARRYAFEEILDTALVAAHYARHAAGYLAPRRRMGALPLATTTWEYHQPVGVVGVIAPWNFPLILSITDVVAALAAGNAVVLRPDVQSSFTALWAAELLAEAGLPDGVLCVVTGEGHELGPRLIDAVDSVMFTGSTRTGKAIARQAADRLISFSLELGGKNPMIVLDDADLDAAADGAVRGAFAGAGQVCVSHERILVDARIAERFTALFLDRVRRLRLGSALDYSTDMGSLTTERQLARVEAHVADAVAKGATIHTGGHRRPDLGPLFFEPTVLDGVRPGMLAYDEETFGPVVALFRYDSIDDAIGIANDTRYGLNASVWSRSVRRARDVARRIRAGTVNINDAYAATWSSTAAPIGGMKESGFGRRHGAEGILKYTETQTIAVQRGLPLAPLPFLSGPAYERLMVRVVRLLRRFPGTR